MLAPTYPIETDRLLLRPLEMEYLRTVAFIVIIASLVQIAEIFLRRAIPRLHADLGVFLPLIATNCAILAVAVIASEQGAGLRQMGGLQNTLGGAVLYGFLASIGFALAIVLFAGIRERLEFSDHPKSFKGFPIALVSAGLLAMAFMGFSGMRI